MNIKAIVEFEAHDDHFLPWDMALDEANRVLGKSPYEGQKVIGFAAKGDLDGFIIYPRQDGWQERVIGLVPVLSENGNWYQLTSHVVRNVRPFEGGK